ncbi:hypothetical protein ACFORJ_01180 [Corynebacterium hansenii]|uniref:Uncharacterized protein n=1 Tax=Corynebacterium hansenii TaxID=394964 RepID=A0ABV7ZKJ7_9CORY|nr:hypothetical protein [Corynebacterium hansenii]WJY99385.1 hypothetical protein CHAN_03810 [Corynebacterium hansenii]
MRNKLQFSLENANPSEHWRAFEKLATAVLASEYPNLRSMASPDGDGGRDAEIYKYEHVSTEFIQVSLAKDFKAKLKQTVNRLEQTQPQMTHLIYVTNQEIGAKADQLKIDFRQKRKIHLDIRDRNWFIERESSSTIWDSAVDDFCRRVADPILSERRLIRRPQQLTKKDAQIAMLQLAFEERDRTGKNLTKACFESLVFSALDGTNAENQMSKEEIIEEVKHWAPEGVNFTVQSDELHDDFLESKVSQAIDRLTKKYQGKRRIVRHGQTQNYHIAHSEQERRNEAAAAVAIEQARLREHLKVKRLVERIPENNIETVIEFLVSTIGRVLLHMGEEFAASVLEGKLPDLKLEYLSAMENGTDIPNGLSWEDVRVCVAEVLSVEDPEIQNYFRRLANSYTFAAFLRRSTDVQKSMSKVWSEGDIWLDTNIILPLFLEEICGEGESGRYARLMKAASTLGVNLYVTEGVIEEATTHISNSINCARMWGANWRGKVPFLLHSYVLNGCDRSAFAAACENLCGNSRPEDDVIEYLSGEHSIECKSLVQECRSAPDELRYAAEKFWVDVHSRRRAGRDGVASGVTDRMADHDIENSVGVLMRRESERSHHLGYSSWWLTTDRQAHGFYSSIVEELDTRAPRISPLMSLEFFSQYLRFAHQSEGQSSASVDVDVFYERLESLDVPDDILDIADAVRAECAGLSERVIRRRVRDSLEQAKQVSS